MSVCLNDVIQLSKAEAEEKIQALTLQAADPRLSEAIGDWSLVWRLDDATIIATEMFVEGLAEFGVSIVYQEPNVDSFTSAHILTFRACCRTHVSVGWYVLGDRNTFRLPR